MNQHRQFRSNPVTAIGLLKMYELPEMGGSHNLPEKDLGYESVPAQNYSNKSYGLILPAASTATIEVQVSLDGKEYIVVDTLNTESIGSYPIRCAYVRINVIAFTGLPEFILNLDNSPAPRQSGSGGGGDNVNITNTLLDVRPVRQNTVLQAATDHAFANNAVINTVVYAPADIPVPPSGKMHFFVVNPSNVSPLNISIYSKIGSTYYFLTGAVIEVRPDIDGTGNPAADGTRSFMIEDVSGDSISYTLRNLVALGAADGFTATVAVRG